MYLSAERPILSEEQLFNPRQNSEYSEAVVEGILDVLTHEQMMLDDLSDRCEMAEDYLREIFMLRMSPTLTDIATICHVLHLDPSEMCGQVEY